MPKKFKCCLGCRTNASAFRFPEEEQRRQQWFQIINMEYTTKARFLCGRHFSSRHYSNRYLRKNAVPDINLEPIMDCPMISPENEESNPPMAYATKVKIEESTTSEPLSKHVTSDKQKNLLKGEDTIELLQHSRVESVTRDIGTQTKMPMDNLDMMLTSRDIINMKTYSKLPTYDASEFNGERNVIDPAIVDCGLEKNLECSSDWNEQVSQTFENEVKENVENFHKKRKLESFHTLVEPVCSGVLTCVTEASQTGHDGLEACGLIQRSYRSRKFSLACFHCSAEYELTDWKQYMMHYNKEHIIPAKPKISKTKLSKQGAKATKRILRPKLAKTTQAKVNSTPLLLSKTNDEPVATEAKNNLAHISKSNDVDSIQNASVINFYYTDQSRTMSFLETLRMHPLLWHPRRYGPALIDKEIEKFLADFGNSISAEDLRNSLENARLFQRRFNPLTTSKKLQLENEPQLQEYADHLNEIAMLGKSFAYNCDYCSFYFLDENQLYKHKFVKHQIGDVTHVCSCGEYFADINEKEEHEISHNTDQPNHKCEHCDLLFFSNKKLENHIVLLHPDAVPNAQLYQCSKCDEKFPKPYMLEWHLSKHDPPRYKCEICGKCYRKAPQYDRHKKKHLDQRDYMCEQCGKTFLSKHHLKRHRLDVHKLGEHFCQHCKHSFANFENLHMHMQKYHPNGTNLDYKKKQHAVHMKRYFQRLKAAKQNQPGVRKPRVLKCKQCGVCFDRMRELRQHKREFGHTLGDRPYKCPHCDSILNSVLCFLNHLRKMHQLPVKYSDIKYYKPYTEDDAETTNADDLTEDEVVSFDDVIAYEEVDEAVQNLNPQDSDIVNVRFFEEYQHI